MRVLTQLEQDLHYSFQDPELLTRALTHSSFGHENTEADNEQLEFLGDAILGFLVSDALFRSHPTLNEGQLSKLKGFFVSAANLVRFAEQLQLGEYLQLGKGEEKTGGRTKQALLVDGLEAILGAIYLDGGLEPVRNLTMRFMEAQIGEIANTSISVSDFKTELQEQIQARQMGRAEYVVAGETGPAHQRLFAVDVVVEGRALATGLGLTKKAAEQAAAREALACIDKTYE